MVLVFGIDPKSKKVTIWGFSDEGAVVATVAQTEEGIWHVESESTNNAGQKIVWKGKFARVGKNELHLDTVEMTVGGAKTTQGFFSQRWKRH